jgi:diaminopimelate epimerase
VRDVDQVDVAGRGRALRFDPAFAPGGANINFIGRSEAGSPDAPKWQIRTYERGVEDETLACGTGTVAAAVALASLGLAELPLPVLSASGKILTVSARIEGSLAVDVWLCGEGRLVARGIWMGGSR